MTRIVYLIIAAQAVAVCEGLAAPTSRRGALGWIGSGATALIAGSPLTAWADADEMDIDSFLRTGGVSMPMGVSGQAGKSKPVTGIVLRDGSELSRDARGNVVAELVVKSAGGSDKMAVLASFSAPWPLGKTGTKYSAN
jgi:hypothetical protein